MAISQIPHLIAGKWVNGGNETASINPSDTTDVVGFAGGADSDLVGSAVSAANNAQRDWETASPELRADILEKAASILFERSTQIGEMLAREEGKTRAEGVGETLRAARILRYFGAEALRLHGRTLSSTRPGLDVATYREAVGVVALITPWNFPIAIPAWKAAPALAFGNTVILKPSEITPATANILGEVLIEAGIPDGVFNIVHGSGDTGAALINHSDVQAVSFTGSQNVGAKVAQAATAGHKRVQMEMGGKNPLVVLADADLDKAVAIAADGGFFQTGQRCTASSRVIVEDSVHDAFVEALCAKAGGLKVGPALSADTQVGPASSAEQLAKNLRYVEIATSEGGRLASGGEAVQCATNGHFMAPTIIADTKADMRINREEVFGPVVSTIRARDYEHALDIANQGDFGLSAGIVTNSMKHVRDFRKRVRAGMVMINLPTAGVDYHVPFGGMRASSYGPREQGFAAAEFYTQIKTVYVGD